jgi:ABC-type uncharacterized transport system auxiliary subunit
MSALMIDRRLFVAGLAASALAACAADPPPPETFYRLGNPAPVQALAGGPIRGVIDVPQVRTQGVVGGRAILYRNAPDQVIAYHYHAWQEPTGVMMQRALLDALRSAQAFETVATPEMRLERNYELMGDLRLLEHVLTGNNVVVEIEISLRRIAGNQQLLSKTYRAEEPAGAAVGSAIPAFTRAVDKITAALLTDLAALPKGA